MRTTVGKDYNKWWIFRIKPGLWLIRSPIDSGFGVYQVNTGAEALKAFADGK
jgi:hypothetical protein